MGRTYIDRMGFVYFINEICYLPHLTDNSNELENIIFLGGATTYYYNGLTRTPEEPSMYDIVLQKI